ncbi:hypothetical protein GQ473_00900 [archaeon]|nr:hypothetical protein [archaeon]
MNVIDTKYIEVEDTDGPTTSLVKIKYTEITGEKDGPKLFVIAGIHGDELTGVEVIRQLIKYFSKKDITGKLTLVPVANPIAFAARQRCTIQDNKDLNRYFPGNPKGTITEKIAYEITEKIIKPNDYGIDLHTGPKGRMLLPHTRIVSDESNKIKALSKLFGTLISMTREPLENTLAISAKAVKTHTIAVELGEGERLDNYFIKAGFFGVLNIAKYLGILDGRAYVLKDQYILNERNNIVSKCTGLFYPRIAIGDVVHKGQQIAEIYDPQKDMIENITAEKSGIVLALQTDAVAVMGTTIISTLTLANCGLNSVSLIQKKCVIYHTKNPRDLLLNIWE